MIEAIRENQEIMRATIAKEKVKHNMGRVFELFWGFRRRRRTYQR
jgi:hypothetical protein